MAARFASSFVCLIFSPFFVRHSLFLYCVIFTHTQFAFFGRCVHALISFIGGTLLTDHSFSFGQSVTFVWALLFCHVFFTSFSSFSLSLTVCRHTFPSFSLFFIIISHSVFRPLSHTHLCTCVLRHHNFVGSKMVNVVGECVYWIIEEKKKKEEEEEDKMWNVTIQTE